MSKSSMSSSKPYRPSASSTVVIVVLCFVCLVYNNMFITKHNHSMGDEGFKRNSNARVPSSEINTIEKPSLLEKETADHDKFSQIQIWKDHVRKATEKKTIAKTYLPDRNETFSRRCPDKNYRCKDDKCKHLSKALIIGVTKCGTTALEWFLLLHDQIQSGVGEPHFFDWHYDRGVDWYCKQMPCTYDNVVVLERTPRYYVHLSQHNVYDFDPNMKLLLIVREPVDRMVSHLVHNYGYHKWEFYKNKVLDSKNGTVKEVTAHTIHSQYFK